MVLVSIRCLYRWCSWSRRSPRLLLLKVPWSQSVIGILYLEMGSHWPHLHVSHFSWWVHHLRPALAQRRSRWLRSQEVLIDESLSHICVLFLGINGKKISLSKLNWNVQMKFFLTLLRLFVRKNIHTFCPEHQFKTGFILMGSGYEVIQSHIACSVFFTLVHFCLQFNWCKLLNSVQSSTLHIGTKAYACSYGYTFMFLRTWSWFWWDLPLRS